MRFKEIITCLTGLNLGPFGAQWSPPEPEISKARRVLTELEDRRVLYNPSSLEVPAHCVDSVIDIRRLLTAELGALDEDTPLASSLRAMRASLDLPRFRGHPIAGAERSVHDAEEPSAVPARLPAAMV